MKLNASTKVQGLDWIFWKLRDEVKLWTKVKGWDSILRLYKKNVISRERRPYWLCFRKKEPLKPDWTGTKRMFGPNSNSDGIMHMFIVSGAYIGMPRGIHLLDVTFMFWRWNWVEDDSNGRMWELWHPLHGYNPTYCMELEFDSDSDCRITPICICPHNGHMDSNMVILILHTKVMQSSFQMDLASDT
jgi:hypothetical protein